MPYDEVYRYIYFSFSAAKHFFIVGYRVNATNKFDQRTRVKLCSATTQQVPVTLLSHHLLLQTKKQYFMYRFCYQVTTEAKIVHTQSD